MRQINYFSRNSIKIIIVISILLFVLIYYLTSVYYPKYIIEKMMQLQPGYLIKLPNDELGRGTFGDMYGALNTFFSGIGIVGLLATIAIQISLYNNDKSTIKREKEKEERDLLYFIYFRIKHAKAELDKVIIVSSSVYDKYVRMEKFSDDDKENLELLEHETKKIDIKFIESLNIEKNHVIYLKYLNDDKFLKFFDKFPSLVNKTSTSIAYSKIILFQRESPIKDFQNKLNKLLADISSSINELNSWRYKDIRDDDINYVYPIIKKYLDSFSYTIPLEETVEILNIVTNYMDKHYTNTFPQPFVELYKYKNQINRSKEECYLFSDSALNTIKVIAEVKAISVEIEDFLIKLKHQSGLIFENS
jgi:hypothetical protein